MWSSRAEAITEQEQLQRNIVGDDICAAYKVAMAVQQHFAHVDQQAVILQAPVQLRQCHFLQTSQCGQGPTPLGYAL